MKSYLAPNEARRSLKTVGDYLVQRGLTWASSGNVSVRLSEHAFMITSSGCRLGSLADEHLPTVNFLEKPTHVDASETRHPSKEQGMHAAAYTARPDWAAMVHVSPPYATLLACSGELPETEVFPEGMMQLRSVGLLRYAHAGSGELADLVGEVSVSKDILILQNHGLLVGAGNLDDALLKVETFEFSCFLTVTARSSGLMLNRLDSAEVQSFLKSEYRR